MAKATTPTFVLKVRLRTEKWQEDILGKKLEFARKMYNHLLGVCYELLEKIESDPRFLAVKDDRKSPEFKKVYKDLIKEAGFSEYTFSKNYVTPYMQNRPKTIPSQAGQDISVRVLQAFEQRLYNPSKRAHFKRFGDYHSMQCNQNTSIRYENGLVEVNLQRNVHKKVQMKPIIKKNDKYTIQALSSRVKFVEIQRVMEKGKPVFYANMYMEGYPPQKERQTQPGKRVGIDIGTSTVAVVSQDQVVLTELAPGLEKDGQKVAELQRKLDRQRRANNPHKFNEDGTIKKGNREKWIISENMKKTRAALQTIELKTARKRKIAHETLANDIIAMGDTVLVETMSFKGLQKRKKKTTINEKTGRHHSKKRFGKTINRHAPAMFLSILDRKLSYHGQKLIKTDTIALKASQYNHDTQEFKKFSLGTRSKEIGSHRVQRDLYSAYLLQHVNEDLQTYDQIGLERNFANFIWLHDQLMESLSYESASLPSSMGVKKQPASQLLLAG